MSETLQSHSNKFYPKFALPYGSRYSERVSDDVRSNLSDRAEFESSLLFVLANPSLMGYPLLWCLH